MTCEHDTTATAKRKRVAVLGSTGSIGVQTLDVIDQHADELQAVALAAGTRTEEVLSQAKHHQVRYVALGSPHAPKPREHHPDIDVAFGMDAIAALCHLPEVDIVVNALVGALGLRASLETLAAGKVLALANKESLVVGGDLVMPLSTHDTLLPIDSEHGAIYQCLLGEEMCEVQALWVTASGGPFRGRTRAELEHITPDQALAHPTWNMGKKISIDSSTLMNKGLEIIEAHHLFSMPYDRINVVVQPQSAIHSMVEFCDGSVKAHLGTTDMRIPIQFALSYPKRLSAPVQPLDFTQLGCLEFAPADTDTFRCLALARIAGMEGGTLPCIMNAANEVAVDAFLARHLDYLGIAYVVESVMDALGSSHVESFEQLQDVDSQARACAQEVIDKRMKRC